MKRKEIKSAEDAARERAAVIAATEAAKKCQAALDAAGISYRKFLELPTEREGLSDLAHNILIGFERGEGWPSG